MHSYAVKYNVHQDLNSPTSSALAIIAVIYNIKHLHWTFYLYNVALILLFNIKFNTFSLLTTADCTNIISKRLKTGEKAPCLVFLFVFSWSFFNKLHWIHHEDKRGLFRIIFTSSRIITDAHPPPHCDTVQHEKGTWPVDSASQEMIAECVCLMQPSAVWVLNLSG